MSTNHAPTTPSARRTVATPTASPLRTPARIAGVATPASDRIAAVESEARAGRRSSAIAEATREPGSGPTGGFVRVPPRARGGESASGRPLADALRSTYERRFGAPLSSVRIHDDASAAKTARAHRANAVTVGEHIHFGRGRFRPDVPHGDRLLTHELTHVLQQRAGGASSSVADAEAEAERAASRRASAGPIAPVRVGARVAPHFDKATAREILDDELDDVFCSVDNAWDAIRKAPAAERNAIKSDRALERNIRRRSSEKDLLKTYLLLTYQTEDAFPDHYAGFIEATYKAGTDEARIYSILRGVDQPTREEMQQMPGFVEVIEDEMSGSELQTALGLLYGKEEHTDTGQSNVHSSTHLEIGKRYLLDVEVRGSLDEVQDNLEQAFRFGGESRNVILSDTSLWAKIADEFAPEEVWYLRMTARYGGRQHFPIVDTQKEPFVAIIWDAVEGAGTDEEKLTKCLADVQNATSYTRQGVARLDPPLELKDDPWFVPMLNSELSGGDLRDAMAAAKATPAAATGLEEELLRAIKAKSIDDIRNVLKGKGATAAVRKSLRSNPEILGAMGAKLSGATLCETTQLLQYGASMPALVSDLIMFFTATPVDAAGAVKYLEGLSAADQDGLIAEPGVYFMLTDLGLGYDVSTKLLAAIRSKDSTWQTPGSAGTHYTQTEAVQATLPVRFTASEARIAPRMNLDTSNVPMEKGKPFRVPSGTIEDWVRVIDDVWNDKYRVKSGTKRLALVFSPYFGHNVASPDGQITVENVKGRSSTNEQNHTMHLYIKDLEPTTVAHEFGHMFGNPDEYNLTPADYTQFTKLPGKKPRGGESTVGLMSQHRESTDIGLRHVQPAVEIVNAARDKATYPDPFTPEKA